MLAIFSNTQFEEQFRGLYGNQPNGLASHEKPHTLEEYALDHFRAPPKSTFQRTLTFTSPRKKNIEPLWRHSREPIKQPLLKKLSHKEELVQESIYIFNYILFVKTETFLINFFLLV